MHVGGVIVHYRADIAGAVLRAMGEIPGVTVAGDEPSVGRLVLVVSTPTLDDQVDTVTRVQRTKGVMAVDVVYHAFDGSPDPSEDHFDVSPATMSWLSGPQGAPDR